MYTLRARAIGMNGEFPGFQLECWKIGMLETWTIIYQMRFVYVNICSAYDSNGGLGKGN